MKKINVLILVSALMSFASTAQQKDTLVYATGKIFNHQTKEPVVARISYQSLPYGNKVGMLNGNTFSFPLYDNEKYSITVEAPGFSPAKYMLDPASANAERKVIQDIPLGLPASASATAATTHTHSFLSHLLYCLYIPRYKNTHLRYKPHHSWFFRPIK